GAQESVRFVVRTGCEEEGVDRTVVRCSVAELERPKAIDGDRLPTRVAQLTAMLESSVRGLLEGVDLSVAEVSHQEIAAEPPEVRRSEREPPGCVQLTMLRDPGEERAGGVVGVDESLPLSVQLIDGVRVLFRVGHEDTRADRLDPERGVAGRQARIDEGPRPGDEGEARVEHVDAAVVEVGRVKPVACGRRRERESLVDRADAGTIGEDDGLIPLDGKPTADLPALSVEDEPSAHSCRPEDRAGGVRWDLYDKRDDRPVGPIEGREARAVVCDPPR